MRESEFGKIEKAILAAYKVPREKIAAEMDAMNEKYFAYLDDESVFGSRAEFYRKMITFFVLCQREKAEAKAAAVAEAA